MKTLFICFMFLVTTSTYAQSIDPEKSCNIQIDNAKALLNPDNTADDEAAFLAASTKALEVCENLASTHENLRLALTYARISCDKTADQGMSQLYRGTCYLRASLLADFILGPIQ